MTDTKKEQQDQSPSYGLKIKRIMEYIFMYSFETFCIFAPANTFYHLWGMDSAWFVLATVLGVCIFALSLSTTLDDISNIVSDKKYIVSAKIGLRRLESTEYDRACIRSFVREG